MTKEEETQTRVRTLLKEVTQMMETYFGIPGLPHELKSLSEEQKQSMDATISILETSFNAQFPPHEPEHPRDEEEEDPGLHKPLFNNIVKHAFQITETECEGLYRSEATPPAALVSKDCYCCSRKTKQSYADHEAMKPAVCADCAAI